MLEDDDFGMYLCIAKNSFAETNGSIKLYSEYSRWTISILMILRRMLGISCKTS